MLKQNDANFLFQIENKAFKWYQAREVLLEPKLYLFYLLGVTNNLPNGKQPPSLILIRANSY
jgi:hypothetical protein